MITIIATLRKTLVKFLIDNGAKVNIKTAAAGDLLALARENGDHDIATLIAEQRDKI